MGQYPHVSIPRGVDMLVMMAYNLLEKVRHALKRLINFQAHRVRGLNHNVDLDSAPTCGRRERIPASPWF